MIRECGIEVKKPEEAEEADIVVVNEAKWVFYAFGGTSLMSRFYKRIEDAYIHANKTLLKLMIDEQELIPHLRYV